MQPLESAQPKQSKTLDTEGQLQHILVIARTTDEDAGVYFEGKGGVTSMAYLLSSTLHARSSSAPLLLTPRDHDTSPVTNQPLANKALTPNPVLQSQILAELLGRQPPLSQQQQQQLRSGNNTSAQGSSSNAPPRQ